jgi:hypothetical protein
MSIYLYQIFYNDETRKGLDPGFIPLDNSESERPDWFEFWPIRNYLKTRDLDDNAWYGFFSPRFGLKTGFTSDYVKSVIQHHQKTSEIALFTSTWDFIAYFKNVFEQGEEWHEGITQVAQNFFDQIGHTIDVSNLVNYSQNSVTSNYFAAKPRFWRRWLHFADKLVEVCETGGSDQRMLVGQTTYGERLLPMKVFIQERLATIILSTEQYNVVLSDQSLSGRIFEPLFYPDIRTRRLLQSCDLLKGEYLASGAEEYLAMYQKLRAKISTKPTRFK